MERIDIYNNDEYSPWSNQKEKQKRRMKLSEKKHYASWDDYHLDDLQIVKSYSAKKVESVKQDKIIKDSRVKFSEPRIPETYPIKTVELKQYDLVKRDIRPHFTFLKQRRRKEKPETKISINTFPVSELPLLKGCHLKTKRPVNRAALSDARVVQISSPAMNQTTLSSSFNMKIISTLQSRPLRPTPPTEPLLFQPKVFKHVRRGFCSRPPRRSSTK